MANTGRRLVQHAKHSCTIAFGTMHRLDTVLIGLLYKAYPDGCQHRLQVLLRLRPCPMRGHWLL